MEYNKFMSIDDVLIEEYNKLLRLKVRKAINDGNIDYLKSKDELVNMILIPELVKGVSLMKSSKSKRQIAFITITKSNSATVEEFIDKIHKLTKLRITQEQYAYCFESTDYKDNIYHNIHCHYLCNKQIGVNKQNYIRRLEKNLGNSIFNINVQIYKTEYYQDKIDYMKGIKDQDQGVKPEITERFRKHYKISPIYRKEDIKQETE